MNSSKRGYVNCYSCSSSTYCQTAFNEECKESFEKARHMDVLEAQTVLGPINGNTWWIRESFSNNQKVYKGIIYLNGRCSYHLLRTDNDWIVFFNKNYLTPDLKTLQKERREKIEEIKSKYIVQLSLSRDYQKVFSEELEGRVFAAHRLDILEAQAVLGGTQGKTWWIRKCFHNGQETYKGVVYLNEKCFYHILLTDNDWIAFFNKNALFPHLETLRKQKNELV